MQNPMAANGMHPAGNDPDEIQLRKLINDSDFFFALEQNPAKIGTFVSSQIVVFENGYRNNGWQEFRDYHLMVIQTAKCLSPWQSFFTSKSKIFQQRHVEFIGILRKRDLLAIR